MTVSTPKPVYCGNEMFGLDCHCSKCGGKNNYSYEKIHHTPKPFSVKEVSPSETNSPKLPGDDQYMDCPNCKAPMLEDEMKFGCGMCGYDPSETKEDKLDTLKSPSHKEIISETNEHMRDTTKTIDIFEWIDSCMLFNKPMAEETKKRVRESIESARAIQHTKSFSEGYKQGRAEKSEAEKKWWEKRGKVIRKEELQRVVEMIEGKLLLTPKSMDNGGRAEIKAWNCALDDLCSDLQSKLEDK